jgi:protease IV
MKNQGSSRWLIITLSILGVAFLLIIMAVAALTESNASANTAHIKIRGIITSGGNSFFGDDTASAEDIVENIKKAEENPSIKAILLDINSPGGSAVASEEIATAIKNAEKPVIALIRDIGTSGAYWAASSSDTIVASPLSITGSVGATASYLEFSDLMKIYGIGYERVVSGKFKDTGAKFRELREEEKELLQEIIELTGTYFAQSVKENRNLDDNTIREISSGRIYTGQQAINLKLIDELGGIEKAKEIVMLRADLESVSLAQYKQKKSFSIASILSSQASIIGKNIGASLIPKETGISLT